MKSLALALIFTVMWAALDTDWSAVGAANFTVIVRSQAMTPTILLDPEKALVQVGDTVTWLNLTGRGIKLTPDWDEEAALPPFIQAGATVRLRFDLPGAYSYGIFSASERFEEDRVPVKVSGVIVVRTSVIPP